MAEPRPVILFVDDDEDYREAIRAILESSGYEMIGAEDSGKPKAVDFSKAKGWMINFPAETKSEQTSANKREECGTSLGERVIGPPQLRAGRVSVVTTNPPGLNCDPNLVGNSWLLSLLKKIS